MPLLGFCWFRHYYLFLASPSPCFWMHVRYFFSSSHFFLLLCVEVSTFYYLVKVFFVECLFSSWWTVLCWGKRFFLFLIKL
jgi:hypothetical protein